MTKITVCLAVLAIFGSLAEGRLSDDPLISEWLRAQNEPVISQEDTFVTIPNGTVQGTTYTSFDGQTIYAYLGIPYAEPPVGNLRFQPPQQYNGWGDDIWNGTQQPHACAQFLTNTTIAEENCLFVSVYTKRRSNETQDPLPVMFWIHGGGLLLGQTSYYLPTRIMNEDVVFVSVQYRLGPLGFFASNDGVFPANNGMKDIVLALRWVQENIEHFGGNPNQVTVFGESAGAAATNFLLLSPQSQGLFHAAAAMSGSSLGEWSVDRNPEDILYKVATELGCDTSSTVAIRDCLLEVDWPFISQAHFFLLLQEQIGNLRALLPGTSVVIEGDVPGAFMPEDPLMVLESGEIPDIPVMFGATQHEGSLLLGVAYSLKLKPEGLLEDPVYVHDHLIGDLLATWNVNDYANGASISQGLALAFLPGNEGTDFNTFPYELMDMLSMMFMKAPILRTVEILSRRLSNVYLYSFEYYADNSIWDIVFRLVEEIVGDLIPVPEFDGGITHADDILSMFEQPLNYTDNDNEFARKYCKLFTNLAIHGNPTPEGDEDFPTWPSYKIDNPQYMTLNLTPTVSYDYPASWRQGMPVMKSNMYKY